MVDRSGGNTRWSGGNIRAECYGYNISLKLNNPEELIVGRRAEVFYFAGVTDEGAGSMMRTPVGQNQTITATTRTQNQNHRRRICLLSRTRKLSVQLAEQSRQLTRPRCSHREASQGGVCEAAVSGTRWWWLSLLAVTTKASSYTRRTEGRLSPHRPLRKLISTSRCLKMH